MKDVARLSGVSIQTVSMVVNDRAVVSPETRERILAAIDELDYRPLAVGRSLRTGSTRTIGLMVSDIANPFFARMADAVEDHAHRSGYNLILYNTHSDAERERTYLQIAAERWVDGMLFVTTTDTLHGLGALRSAGIRSWPWTASQRTTTVPGSSWTIAGLDVSWQNTCWTSVTGTWLTCAGRSISVFRSSDWSHSRRPSANAG